MRSPTPRATVNVAVATAMPSASAAAVNIFRRGLRTKDSPSSRVNMSVMDHRVRIGQRRKIDDHFAPGHRVFHGDRIASAGATDRRHVDRRAAVAADHVLSLLPVAYAPANLAGVESRGVVAVGLVHDHKSHAG